MKILLINPPNCGKSIPEERYGIDSIRQIFRGEPLALQLARDAAAGGDRRFLQRAARAGSRREPLQAYFDAARSILTKSPKGFFSQLSQTT